MRVRLAALFGWTLPEVERVLQSREACVAVLAYVEAHAKAGLPLGGG